VDAYTEGVKAGTLRPLDAKLTVSLLLGIASWMHRWYRLDGRLSAAQMADYAEDMVYDGLRTGAPTSGRRTPALSAPLGPAG
jgi:hypothetical protein